jgi:hypothetical protein
MRKIISAFTVAAFAVVLTLTTAAPASALTGTEKLGCSVTPSPTQPNPTPKICSNKMAASSYTADFQVLNERGPYSYAWSVPAGYNVLSGCTSGLDYCIINNLVPVQQVSVSVIITQAGQSATLMAAAIINAYCGSVPCPQ